jgi:anaerobic magnesium-protoporphyrin IX monomethyl ester cyclase
MKTTPRAPAKRRAAARPPSRRAASRQRPPPTAAKARQPDLTLVNLNMLYIRYAENVERERHLPLGPLYLTTALERAGFVVDFRDYQVSDAPDPFELDALVEFCHDPAPVLGLSCMANLLPFTILAAQRLKQRFPDRTLVLGGVGAKGVERLVLERFPWIDLIAHGEAERSGPALLSALRNGGSLEAVPGIFRRAPDGRIVEQPPPPRIEDVDGVGRPAYHHVDLARYDAYGMVTSRGCPYPCTFCSVAPVWGRAPTYRSARDVVAEMRELHDRAGVDLFLFQDEFFVASKPRVLEFCDVLRQSGLKVRWKAFGRVNLTDREMMEAMARTGCLEIRYGIESGSRRILELTKKGFTPEESIAVISEATTLFPRVDSFFIWGFPFETMAEFHESVFQMVSFRLMGSRILPSLLCLLPQTEVYRNLDPRTELQFCRELMPEYMITGHETLGPGVVDTGGKHGAIFDFVRRHPDVFPGFFLPDVETNIRPKFQVLQAHGFYRTTNRLLGESDSCGAHSPR